MRVTYCDNCGEEIKGGVWRSNIDNRDYCGAACIAAAVAQESPKGCPHKDNIDGTTHGTPAGRRRLVCTACGYDREEEIEEEAAV